MEFNKARSIIKMRISELLEKVSLLSISIMTNFFLVIYLLAMSPATILVPPHLTKEATVARNYASKEYLEGYVYWLTGVISSVTPGNADYVYKWVEPFFDKKVWVKVGPQILALKSNPKFNGVNAVSYFVPEGIEYEAASETFYVYGKLTSSQYRKGLMKNIRSIYATYEVKMSMDGYYPKVTHWRPYEGVPMTKEWREKNQSQAGRREAEIQKAVENNQVLPHADESKIIKEKEIEPENASAVSATDQAAASPPQASSASDVASQILQGIKPPASEINPADKPL